MLLLSPWVSSWVSDSNTHVSFSLLTSRHDNKALFIKVYSLERTTIQQSDAQAIQPDKVMVTAGDAEGTGSEADASDKRSEGQVVQSLLREPGEQDRVENDVIYEQRHDRSEEV